MQSFSDPIGLDDSDLRTAGREQPDGPPGGPSGAKPPDGPPGSGPPGRPGAGRGGGPLSRPAADSLPVVAGAAAAMAGAGAALALLDIGSPLRAPFTLFFLIVAPACGVAAALRGLDPLSRAVVAAGGAVAVDLLTAQTMLALHSWTVRGGVAAVAAVSLLLFLLAHAWRHRGRGTSDRTT
ncbi:hypothetical protein [Streptomyces mobaraensis]|uniref:Uncharacterized protein n=1 Tax=Streptomyces mobaraensis (strain ATCC 29032 / DSM 40847 / JCM 4168 / NBRC 13819 / NCIMB 11159 / IPCR 16-22) TaxID=1223523 RepID=M3C6G7_STRM1|nr:hypothetical protein [Streptomyces mobaraensis]EME99516.1 hypothetical protein H340_15811 [Streptomyces mobaraensis NBRC 13819 = DSM 40847]